jgi:hypothetical protein
MNDGGFNGASVRRVKWLTLGMVAVLVVFPSESVAQSHNASGELKAAGSQAMAADAAHDLFVEDGTTEPGPSAGTQVPALGVADWPFCICPSGAYKRCFT